MKTPDKLTINIAIDVYTDQIIKVDVHAIHKNTVLNILSFQKTWQEFNWKEETMQLKDRIFSELDKYKEFEKFGS